VVNILILSVQKRKTCAVKVQGILTDSDCVIKTRLGICDSSSNSCSDTGLIILELTSEENAIKNLITKLKKIEGIKIKFVKI
jgi:hypothetical protein